MMNELHSISDQIAEEADSGSSDSLTGKARAILAQRAKELAKPLKSDVEELQTIEVVVFNLANESYAVESGFIEEVYHFEQITKLPNTPKYVHGVINVRRKVVSVINLKKVFDLPENESRTYEKTIILDNQKMQFGILADEIVGVRKISLANLQQALPTLSGIGKEFIKGITNEPLIVLDGEKILSSELLVVKEKI
jgi:purine-binding chemotaxis protein CheW